MNVSLDNSPTYACRVCAKQFCGCKDENSPAPCHFYTAPQQRPWQGLTDEEIEEGQKQSWVDQQAWQAAVWWAEDKLREKNA